MNILEKDIEDLIYDNIDNRKLMSSKGFNVFENKYYRQPNLGSYGIPDIIGVSVQSVNNKYRYFSFTVYELKKDIINVQTLLQASRYVRGIKYFFDSVNKDETKIYCDCKMVLIGKTIDTSGDFVFLIDNVPNCVIYTYELDFSLGLSFINQSGYKISNPSPVNIAPYFEDFRSGGWHNSRIKSEF